MAVGPGALPVAPQRVTLFPQVWAAGFTAPPGGRSHEVLLVPGLGSHGLTPVPTPVPGRPAIHRPMRTRPWALARVGETEAGRPTRALRSWGPPAGTASTLCRHLQGPVGTRRSGAWARAGRTARHRRARSAHRCLLSPHRGLPRRLAGRASSVEQPDRRPGRPPRLAGVAEPSQGGRHRVCKHAGGLVQPWEWGAGGGR